MTLGEKITILRKQKGWSQEELADRLDISRQSVSKWESNASVPDLDKIIKLSVIFSVSTDYLLKDEMEENYVPVSAIENGAEEEIRNVSMEEAVTYMEDVKKVSLKYAVAVMLCVLSPIAMIVMGGMSEFGVISMKEDAAGGIGMIVLFLFLIVAVPVLIMTGISMSKYEYLEKVKIRLASGVDSIVRERQSAYTDTFRKSVAVGVAFIFVGVSLLFIPAIVFEDVKVAETYEVYALGGMLALVACAVFIFVKSGTIWSSFQKLLQEGDFTVEEKENSKIVEYFSGAYWCLATAIYLYISFSDDAWDTSWILWPVAGTLYAAFVCIINAVCRKRKKNEE